MSRGAVRVGLRDLDTDAATEVPGEAPSGRLRRPGGGRKRLTQLYPDHAAALERQLEPVTRGDPEGPPAPGSGRAVPAHQLPDASLSENGSAGGVG